VNDLWNRCRSALGEQLAAGDWRRSIAPLRACVDGDILYLWVGRDDDDWRSIPNPAKDFDREIREAARRACGRAPRDVRYLDRPPNREETITLRRVREHRESEHAAEAREREELDAFAAEEYLQLKAEILRNPRILGTRGNQHDLRMKVQRMVLDRAKRRQERERWRSRHRPFSRTEPPPDPPRGALG
jgi:hypothetical protein